MNLPCNWNVGCCHGCLLEAVIGEASHAMMIPDNFGSHRKLSRPLVPLSVLAYENPQHICCEPLRGRSDDKIGSHNAMIAIWNTLDTSVDAQPVARLHSLPEPAVAMIATTLKTDVSASRQVIVFQAMPVPSYVGLISRRNGLNPYSQDRIVPAIKGLDTFAFRSKSVALILVSGVSG